MKIRVKRIVTQIRLSETTSRCKKEKKISAYLGKVKLQIRAFESINPFSFVNLNPKDFVHHSRLSGRITGRVLTEHLTKNSGSGEVIRYSCSDSRIFRKTTDHVY